MYNPIAFSLCFLSLLSCLFGFGRYAYGAFLPDIRETLTLNYIELGSISTFATLSYIGATILASIIAVHVNTRLLLMISGGLCLVGLLMVAQAETFAEIIIGMCAAGIGAAIAPPVFIELIAIHLHGDWRNRAIGAINAGATPGIVITGIIGTWFNESWREVWTLFAAVTAIVVVWNIIYFPSSKVGMQREAYVKISMATLFNHDSFLIAFLAIAYGYFLGYYYTFSIDYAVEEFGLSLAHSKTIWLVVGLSGLPAIFTGVVVQSLGLRRLLILCFIGYIASGLIFLVSYLHYIVVFISAAFFGLTSIATGCALMILSTNLYSSRPSLGVGIFYFAQAIALILSPVIGGIISANISRPVALMFSMLLLVCVFPIVCFSQQLRRIGERSF